MVLKLTFQTQRESICLSISRYDIVHGYTVVIGMHHCDFCNTLRSKLCARIHKVATTTKLPLPLNLHTSSLRIVTSYGVMKGFNAVVVDTTARSGEDSGGDFDTNILYLAFLELVLCEELDPVHHFYPSPSFSCGFRLRRSEPTQLAKLEIRTIFYFLGTSHQGDLRGSLNMEMPC
ncbi:hypothetical protein BDP27DRAFT_410825 [Rhodocollybia butyracea]|uniref:Uncharacterized protein n=1 Tax=Rhodocollybia butyracea TaxID=206335 RepID=A0A9P5Q2H3_9AGAR|nr:hypothetical protein BDP27DRAFT_410825 [Rhodocollybia butyracea]